MKTLGIDCSGKLVRVFAQNGKKVKAVERAGVSGTDSLLPLVDECLNDVGLSAKDISSLAIGLGPGSWTGSRVCVATSLGLISALKDVKIYTYSSFDLVEYGIDKFDYSVVGAYASFVFLRKCGGEACCVEKSYVQKLILEGAVVVGEEKLFDGQVQVEVDFASFVQNKIKTSGSVGIDAVEPIYLKLSQAEEQLKKKRGAV